MAGNGGPVTGQGIPIANLVHLLSQQLGRIVLDNTGLTGIYDVTLKWTPDESTPMSEGTGDGSQKSANAPPHDSSGSSIFTAIQEQLGLELKSQTGPVGFSSSTMPRDLRNSRRASRKSVRLRASMTVSRHCLGLSPWLGINFSLSACFFLIRSTSF